MLNIIHVIITDFLITQFAHLFVMKYSNDTEKYYGLIYIHNMLAYYMVFSFWEYTFAIVDNIKFSHPLCH